MIWRIYVGMAIGTMLVAMLYALDMLKAGYLGDAFRVNGHEPPTMLTLAFVIALTGLIWPVTWAMWLKDYDDSDGDWKG